MALPEHILSRLSLPMVAAPMFIISNPDLVIAQCKAGIIGGFAVVGAPFGVPDDDGFGAGIGEHLG